jgi:hypothetical protein
MDLVRGKKPGTDFYNDHVPHLGAFQSCAVLLLSIHPEYELTGREAQYQRLLEAMKMGQTSTALNKEDQDMDFRPVKGRMQWRYKDAC